MISELKNPTGKTGRRAAMNIVGTDNQPAARVIDLVKHFVRNDGARVRAIDGISLDINSGEFVVLLGPSGCGKTTLLRSVAGLESCDSGAIEVHSATVYDSESRTEVPPEKRDLSMIFQSYALWPHMSVFDNIAYPLRRRTTNKLSKEGIRERVERVMKSVGVEHLGKQYPSHLSGGQQQRVALARAIVAESKLVLFDEPLSNVDAKVREQLRIDLIEMQARLGFSALYVTHDQNEAMGLGHRIAVLKEGKIEQLGGPQEIYDKPVSRYVANFVGSSNEVLGTVSTLEANGQATVTTALGEILGTAGYDGLAVDDEVSVTWRPERTHLAQGVEATGRNAWTAEVEAALFLGPYREHIVAVDGHEFRTRDNSQLLSRGDKVTVSVEPEFARILRADSL